MIFLQLFFEFFKTGLFAIGGGMATIPFLYNMSTNTGWFTFADITNMVAVSESTPGPIGVNMATYVGYVIGSGVSGVPTAILGAVTATLGLITPSIIIIILISAFLKNFGQNKMVKNAFYGLRPASTGLITAAGLSILMLCLFPSGFAPDFFQTVFNWKGLILAVVIWVLTNKVKATKMLHPIIFILASAVVGIIIQL